MSYVLDNNVEIIKGSKNACIYNLNTRKLYTMDSTFLGLVMQVLNSQEKELNETLREVHDMLLKEKILVNSHNISSKFSGSNARSGKIEFAWIEITQNCNLRCKHCYEEASVDSRKYSMSMNDFEIVIRRLKQQKIKNIQLIGGEPLLHPDIIDMIELCANEFEYIEIFTNGTLLTENLLHKIRDNGIKLAFSLYAENEKIHDSVTQIVGSFQQTYNNLQKALNYGIECRVGSVEMDKVPQYEFKSIKVEHRSDLPRITGKANLLLYNKDMIRRKLITKKSFSTPIDVDGFYNNMTKHNCFGYKIYIDVNLNVFPCVMERRFLHGNIRKNEISDILDSNIVDLNKDLIDDCRHCEFRYVCYDCRPDANGNFPKAKPWYCTYNPYSGIWYDVETFIDDLSNQYKGGESSGSV